MPRRRRKKKASEEINSSSMADIAFLLLVFFLVTTTVLNEKGIWFTLPKKKDDKAEVVDKVIEEKNVMEIYLNSANGILARDNRVEKEALKELVKSFVSNRGRRPDWSVSPKESIVIFRSDRGTDGATYIYVFDALLGAYNELRAEYVGLSMDQYLKLDFTIPENKAIRERAEKEYPTTLVEKDPSGEIK